MLKVLAVVWGGSLIGLLVIVVLGVLHTARERQGAGYTGPRL